MNNTDDEQEFLSSAFLDEKFKDPKFSHKVSALCLLVAIGASDEIKEKALMHLEDFLNQDVRVASDIYDYITRVYLTNSTESFRQYILSVGTHYTSFSDSSGSVQLVSKN